MKWQWFTIIFRFSAFTAFLFFSFIAAAQGEKRFNPNQQYSEAALKDDLKVLREVLEDLHPGLYRYNSKTSFDAYMDDLIASQEEQPFWKFYKTVARLVAGINDGHTRCKPPVGFFRDQKLFPLDVVVIDGELIVERDLSPEGAIPRGAMIQSIGGRYGNVIVKNIYRFMSSDGFIETSKAAAFEDGGFGRLLKAFEDRHIRFDLSLRLPNGAYKKAQLTAMYPHELEFARKVRYPEYYEPGSPIQISIDPEKKTAWLTVNTFHPQAFRKQRLNYPRFIRRTFKKLKKEGIEHLVIDLRENQGGELSYASYLFNFVTDKPVQWLKEVQASIVDDFPYTELGYINRSLFGMKGRHFQLNEQGEYILKKSKMLKTCKPHKHRFEGQVYWLTSGKTFSAAALLVSAAKAHAVGKIVGEETGGAYDEMSAGSTAVIQLPNTRIEVQIPLFNLVMDVPAQEIGRGVNPDVYVDPSIPAFRNRENILRSTVLGMIEGKN